MFTTHAQTKREFEIPGLTIRISKLAMTFLILITLRTSPSTPDTVEFLPGLLMLYIGVSNHSDANSEYTESREHK